MHTGYFWLYHLLGWGCVYSGLILSLYLRPFFNKNELVFAAILVLSTCFYASWTRWGYKRWISEVSLTKQTCYFFIQAIIGASCATLVLIASVFLASWLHWIHPISSNGYGIVANSIFWGNVTNMFVALLVWSILYMAILRARLLNEAKQELASSQLHNLLQQLNPHFLFNVLNNIRALILEDPNRARDAVAQLSDMLRYSLTQFEMNKVSFAEELAIVQEYLSLCKIQFEHRLTYSFAIEPSLNQALIPRMLLQLCIENAIKHGIGKLKQGGLITVSAQAENNSLLIAITNPMPKQKSQPLNDQEQGRGIGLRNIKQRFTLLYPKAQYAETARIELDTNNSDGLATVTINLPLEYAGE